MIFNIYQSVKWAYVMPGDIHDLSFSDIIKLLRSVNKPITDKHNNSLFNLCSWIENPGPPPLGPPNAIRRCKDNIKELYALMLDVDGSMSYAEAKNQWKDYEFYAYSTFNHSKDKDKFRLLVPLLRPIPKQDFIERKNAIIEQFKVDTASFSLSQCFYFPSYHEGNEDIIIDDHHIAPRFDIFTIDPLPIQKIDTSNYIPPIRTRSSSLVKDTLMRGSNMHYNHALPLAIICKNAGLDAIDYIGIIRTIAAHDSVLRTKTDSDLTKLFKSGYDQPVRRTTRYNLMVELNCPQAWKFKI